jgi:dimethylargininase
MIRAITRSIPASFAHALSAAPPDPPIDIALASAQHAAYCAALAACGVAVETLAADDACPDGCFVEDTAVVVGERALITRPGAPSRRAETAAIAAALARWVEVVEMTPPATLDGGDCLRLGDTIFVGRSQRSNADGIAQLAVLGLRVVPVDLPAGVLHLKCVCSPLPDGRILLAEGSLDPATFGAAAVWVPAAESYAANAVAVGDHVLAAAGFPRTHDALAAAGFIVHAVPCSEVRKADGSLTCQSILISTGSDGA